MFTIRLKISHDGEKSYGTFQQIRIHKNVKLLHGNITINKSKHIKDKQLMLSSNQTLTDQYENY